MEKSASVEQLLKVNSKQHQIIEQLRAEVEKHRWIPVSERLPKYLTLVYVCIERDNGHRMIRIRQMGKPREWFDEYDRSTMDMKQVEENVTHWKPIILPEALKGKPI